jgi:GDP-D-mannose dehydratase
MMLQQDVPKDFVIATGVSTGARVQDRKSNV